MYRNIKIIVNIFNFFKGRGNIGEKTTGKKFLGRKCPP